MKTQAITVPPSVLAPYQAPSGPAREFLEAATRFSSGSFVLKVFSTATAIAFTCGESFPLAGYSRSVEECPWGAELAATGSTLWNVRMPSLHDALAAYGPAAPFVTNLDSCLAAVTLRFCSEREESIPQSAVVAEHWAERQTTLRMSPAEYDRAVEILEDETPPPAGLIDLFKKRRGTAA